MKRLMLLLFVLMISTANAQPNYHKSPDECYAQYRYRIASYVTAALKEQTSEEIHFDNLRSILKHDKLRSDAVEAIEAYTRVIYGSDEIFHKQFLEALKELSYEVQEQIHPDEVAPFEFIRKHPSWVSYDLLHTYDYPVISKGESGVLLKLYRSLLTMSHRREFFLFIEHKRSTNEFFEQILIEMATDSRDLQLSLATYALLGRRPLVSLKAFQQLIDGLPMGQSSSVDRLASSEGLIRYIDSHELSPEYQKAVLDRAKQMRTLGYREDAVVHSALMKVIQKSQSKTQRICSRVLHVFDDFSFKKNGIR